MGSGEGVVHRLCRNKGEDLFWVQRVREVGTTEKPFLTIMVSETVSFIRTQVNFFLLLIKDTRSVVECLTCEAPLDLSFHRRGDVESRTISSRWYLSINSLVSLRPTVSRHYFSLGPLSYLTTIVPPRPLMKSTPRLLPGGFRPLPRQVSPSSRGIWTQTKTKE